MAQTSNENKVCDSCGAEARPNARFCFSCGGILRAKNAADDVRAAAAVSSFKNGDANDNNRLPESSVQQNSDVEPAEIKVVKVKKQIITKEVSAPESGVNQTRDEPEIQKTTGIHEQARLKSAASLRRKSKTLQPKIVEEVWQEHENAPNLWFIAAVIFLTVLAGAFLYLAMYLK